MSKHRYTGPWPGGKRDRGAAALWGHWVFPTGEEREDALRHAIGGPAFAAYKRFMEHSAELPRASAGLGKPGVKPVPGLPEWFVGEPRTYHGSHSGRFSSTFETQEQNMKPKPSMRSEAQFKRDEELFPRLKIHRKTRAIVFFTRRDYGVCVHAGAKDSRFGIGYANSFLNMEEFDDYVGTVTLSNT